MVLVCIILGIGTWAYMNDMEEEAIFGSTVCIGTLILVKCLYMLYNRKEYRTRQFTQPS